MAISVTHFIEIPEVRREFSTRCPNEGPNTTSGLEVKSTAQRPSTVGSAFDYLYRYWLIRNTNVQNDVRKHRLSRHREEMTAFEDAVEARENYLENGQAGKELMKAALFFAQWDRYMLQSNRVWHISRGHFTEDDVQGDVYEPDESKLGDFADADLVDLSAMFSLLQEEEPLLGAESYLQPDFGHRLYILKGIGDCLIDNTLVDVKTTAEGTWTREYWQQLVSYVLLNSINNALIEGDYHGKCSNQYPEIKDFGVYFARYGELVTYPVSSLFESEQQFKQFRAWFTERAIEENRQRTRDYNPIMELLCEPYQYNRQSSLSDW